MLYPKSEWQWQGIPGHCIVGDRCVYHLNTVVGPWLVSTIGEYKAEGWRSPVTEIGAFRMYETMVFRAARCEVPDECGEWHQQNGVSLDAEGAQTRREARENHLRLCEKWAAIAPSEVCHTENCDTTLGAPRDRNGFCERCADELEAIEREERERTVARG
jgi:hypothetical protein